MSRFISYIELDRIHVAANRQRRQFDVKALAELAESIQARGLFHNIVLRPPRDDEPRDKLVLVSGERRLRAISDLYALGGSFRYDSVEVPAGKIPYTNLGDLPPLEAEEAELEENIRRMDLSWQERAAATKRLADLRGAQAAAAGAPSPTTASIAEEVRGSSEGSNQETTRREILVAKHLHDPEVRSAKSVDDAFKLLRRKEESAKRVQLAAAIGKTFSSAAHKVFCEDSILWMKAQPPEQFDVILTDPPYGMGADEFGDSGGMAAGAHGYADDYETWVSTMKAATLEFFRLAKPRAHAYIFCDPDKFAELRLMMKTAGWLVFRTPFIWHKPNGMRAPWPEWGPQRKYEIILYAIKGNRPVTRLYSDVLTYTADANLGHSAQKPVALFSDLLRRSVNPGDAILDPFCGTGPVFPAAHEFKCKATGVEIDPGAYSIAAKRIEGLDKEVDLLEGL